LALRTTPWPEDNKELLKIIRNSLSIETYANMDKVQSFWKTSTYVQVPRLDMEAELTPEHSAGVMPGLARIQQSVKEQFGGVDDKVRKIQQELEVHVDNSICVHSIWKSMEET
jgi:hypothetical protein